jgi:flagellar basal-body rod modification protein FlgD
MDVAQGEKMTTDSVLQARMSMEERADIEAQARELNARVNQGRLPQQELGKDDFLKLLITQLSYQDPMSPMEDREFISQMAQFSTLEQMTGIAGDFSRLTRLVTSNEAQASLGRPVEIAEGDRTIQGTVKAVTRGEGIPQVLVNGYYHDWDHVVRVFEE